jgi:glyoxalase family protein
MPTIAGLHHVTAITSDAQANLDFYRGLLGLRLVKLTVNFDDPTSYHFYYGDGAGHPGTILTFFAWAGGVRGRIGAGQTATTAFTIAPESLDFWRARLVEQGISYTEATPFTMPLLRFSDPDGLALELATDARAAERPGWNGGPIPAQHVVRGLHAVTVWERDPGQTVALLTGTLGFQEIARSGNIARYAVGMGGPGAQIDVQAMPAAARGVVAGGTVHHVAWRAEDDAAQLEWRARLVEERHQVSPVVDRDYFHSIYFREPGGVLFEIATDLPGFAVDEAPAELGTHLKLPRWLEEARDEITLALPPIKLLDVGR